MKNELQKYFPLIRTREEVLDEIRKQESLQTIYEGWHAEQREEFLDFCTGVRGVRMLYDSFFKEILNPDTVPERLNEFLTLLLGKKVKILHALPNDSTRIADECSLVIMDIVVQLEDGSLANIEIQKIGYLFPGERSACYSADLLLRQYKRVRGERKKKFSYRDIKTVYTIVLFEESTREFHEYPDTYVHHFKQTAETGLDINLLQEYFFIPLDIFGKIIHNTDIDTKLKAWLTFLCIDEPEMIVKLLGQYPGFRIMYEEVYAMCRNVERVMSMFSKELQELDRNTVQYMIDEMQETIDRKDAELGQKDAELDRALKIIEELKKNQKE